jgi:hypothetical protein
LQRLYYPAALLVLCGDDLSTMARTGNNPDREQGQRRRGLRSGSWQCYWLADGGSDFNDLHGRRRDAVRLIVDSAISAHQPATALQFLLQANGSE